MNRPFYNAYNPLATPAQLLSWIASPITAVTRFMAKLDEAQDMMDDLRKQQRARQALGTDCFNR